MSTTTKDCTFKKSWHPITAYGQPNLFNATLIVGTAHNLGYEIDRPVWLSGEYHSGVFCTNSEYAALITKVIDMMKERGL